MTNQTTNITALTQSARPDVVSAIRQASAQTGVDFAYLLEKASAESSFDPKAQAETSSARGLYQFIDKTWLDTLDKHGAAHGYPNVASAIKRDGAGNPVVSNAAAKEYILELRDNPRISALMAAEFAQDNQQTLEHSLGRDVGNAELYMAHFLGAEGAAKFLGTMEQNPGIAADHIVPAAARANRGVFYDHGRALTLDQVFARFEGKFSDKPAPQPESAQAANIAASDPALAALQVVQARPERAVNAVRPDVAMQLFTLTMLEAFNAPADDRDNPNEWVV